MKIKSITLIDFLRKFLLSPLTELVGVSRDPTWVILLRLLFWRLFTTMSCTVPTFFVSTSLAKRRFAGYLMLLVLLLLSSIPAAFAEAEATTVPTSCEDIRTGNLIVKYKTTVKHKSAIQYHRQKASKHIQAHLKNFQVNSFKSMLNIEDLMHHDKREIIPSRKMNKRKKELLGLSLQEGLEDIYLMHIDPKANMLLDWIDAAQGKLEQVKCTKILALMAKLNADPQIDFVEPDYLIKLKNFKPEDFGADITSAQARSEWRFDYDALWGQGEIGTSEAWRYTRGKGAIVAVIDSGVNYNHPDLWNNIWVNDTIVPDRNRDGRKDLNDLDTNANKKLESHEVLPGSIGFDFIDNDHQPMDEAIGHGTHVAGIIAAESGNNIGIAGVAPEARIMPLKIFSNSGQTHTSLLIQALHYAAQKGADVCNLSLTGTSYSKALAKTIRAVSKEMVVVAAAGNENRDISNTNSSTIASPAVIPEVITVAAMTNARTKASFSNHGFNIDFAAPGSSKFGSANILSTDINSSGYRLRAGTSMATPFVVGAVAILKARRPNLHADEVRNLLRLKTIPVRSSTYIGAGLIQLPSALTASTKVPRVKLKIAEYQYPKLKSLSGLISVKGSIIGTDLVSYEIKLGQGTNPLEWDSLLKQQQRFMKKGVLLKALETRAFANGIYTMRLSAVNSLGEVAYDDALVLIQN
jgi:subtilisin family serine protease